MQLVRWLRVCWNAIHEMIAKTLLTPIGENAVVPHFKECAKHPHIEADGYVLYYTNQCPFNGKYVPIIEQFNDKRFLKMLQQNK